MKKSKVLRRVSVIALSAVMTASVAFAAAACGGGSGDNGGNLSTNDLGYRSGTPGRGTDPNKLTVYIFCNDSDAATNRAICNEYMDAYNAAHNTHYTVDFFNETDKADYFDNLSNYWSNNNMYDIMYLAPRYVRTYAETGAVLNLADYIDTVSADPALSGDAAKAANREVLGEIWPNALSYYSYKKTSDMSYTRGQAVHYDKDQNGFYTDANNEEVGLYGLPKDFSNFSTGYNNLFFTDAIKQAVTTTLAVKQRTVKGGSNETPGSVSKDRNYSQDSGVMPNGKSVVQYAVTGEYTNPYTGESKQAKEGNPAPIINVGVPTRYFPFNFYRYDNYGAALQGGDPLACLCEAYTNGEGYVVTIPGFPNDELKVSGANTVNTNAAYDETVGHITYTYGEYAAFIWAMTYYLNTFDWQKGDGKGGVDYNGLGNMAVFGGEQYEGNSGGAVGAVLYLLPWLYGNDADFINLANALCTYRDEQQNIVGQGADITDPAKWRDYVSKDTNDVTKVNLDGTVRKVAVQYGFNSERFLETYGAFLALASDWNANNGGDSKDAGENNGWSYFRAGRSLFYGAGSWDGATRNDTHLDVLDFGQMPTPVSERYALYSKVKGANYTMEEYSNGATGKGTGDAAANDNVQRTNLSEGKTIYSAADIQKNQMLRQDKWGARMDSVGYAVNGQVTNYTGDHAWKMEAAIGMVMALTIDPEAQVTLTYAGAQFPNFRNQMEQFVDYQKYGADGAFKDMITPEGFSTTQYYTYNDDGSVTVNPAGQAEAKEIWDGYYKLALEMERLVTNTEQNSTTVSQYLEGKTITVGGQAQAVKYDPAYANTPFANFAGSTKTAFLGYAMKVLRMVPLNRMTREINIRMQCGLNAARDSTMYTYNDAWVKDVDARNSTTTMLAYTRGEPVFVGKVQINSSNLDVLRNGQTGIKQSPSATAQTWETPVVYVLKQAQLCQNALSAAVKAEGDQLTKLMQTK